MRDFARSDDPAVQSQLDRLAALSVPQGRLGLETIRALLARLSNPQRRLPPVFHVAGTNGKGSTCAFLRAIMEADSKRVHVTTSPHLVRYNERIRVAGELIRDARLATVLSEVLDAGEDLGPSFFEVTVAAAFLEFSRVPADACVVEVGLGGRFDATNVLGEDVLAACGIAALGIDHEQFLLAPEGGVPTEPLARIAFEKAGITKPGVPLCALSCLPAPMLEIERAAMTNGAPLALGGRDWQVSVDVAGLHYEDRHGPLELPIPHLLGAHQAENAGLAIAMLRHQDRVSVGVESYVEAMATAQWPARLQRLGPGPLAGTREVWLDGGHNASAGAMLAAHFAGRPLHLVIGMLTAKDPASLVRPLATSLQSITAVPVPGHEWHGAEAFGVDARLVEDVAVVMADLPDDGLPVLIAGSLYLAGEVLRLNGEIPR
ncbi:bifunctional folylpolyglutamate synthase/dihydrofolate synthase [Erythrobacter litoralis]|uniref:bifunctional folylpolyglutamate synthase/dihydrofolate synthase n=1 Tax=Erythrobacter litoralis TaxID=39960 RepID=UPI002435E23A|nr:bifunctional folylpolyglutamate synthase/dihydrofolate synthase [Erythrobacter litoralis]MDG6079600.1 bifunctional folylpolyglutamate synthase/dihydrofolate synthase [Erythrobacter litoralis]